MRDRPAPPWTIDGLEEFSISKEKMDGMDSGQDLFVSFSWRWDCGRGEFVDPVTIFFHFNAQFDVGRRLLKYFAELQNKSNAVRQTEEFPYLRSDRLLNIATNYIHTAALCASHSFRYYFLCSRTVNIWTWHANMAHRGNGIPSYIARYCSSAKQITDFCFVFSPSIMKLERVLAIRIAVNVNASPSVLVLSAAHKKHHLINLYGPNSIRLSCRSTYTACLHRYCLRRIDFSAYASSSTLVIFPFTFYRMLSTASKAPSNITHFHREYSLSVRKSVHTAHIHLRTFYWWMLSTPSSSSSTTPALSLRRWCERLHTRMLSICLALGVLFMLECTERSGSLMSLLSERRQMTPKYLFNYRRKVNLFE